MMASVDAMSDVQLLQAWQAGRDSAAMDELVRRQASFVYGAALRMMRNNAWAEDVTQAVFLLLIQKSPRFARHDAELAAWLHRTTIFACKNARRLRTRRARHEGSAAQPDVDRRSDPADAAMSADEARLLPLLDDAIAQLGPRERDGVIGWYFKRRTFRQIGQEQGVSEDAARKRVTRAVERMRAFFEMRGVTMSDAAISACLVTQGATNAAASSIAEAISSFATAAHLANTSTPLGATAPAIVKGVIHSMFITKLKTAAAAAIITVAMLGAAATFATGVAGRAPSVQAAAPLKLTTTSNADDTTVDLANGTTLELLGVSPRPATKASWFTIDGSPIDHNPSGPFVRDRTEVSSTHQMALRLRGPGDAQLRPQIPDATDVNDFVLDNAAQDQFFLISFTPKPGASTMDMKINVADGEWTRIAEAKYSKPSDFSRRMDSPRGSVAITHIIPTDRGGCEVYVVHEIIDEAFRVSAVDENGERHACQNIWNAGGDKFVLGRIEFALPPERITAVVLEARPFNKVVTVKNIALQSGKTSKPEIQVTEEKK